MCADEVTQQVLYFLQGNTLATFSFEASRCYGIVSSPALSTHTNSIETMLSDQLSFFLTLQNNVFSTFIQLISSHIVVLPDRRDE